MTKLSPKRQSRFESLTGFDKQFPAFGVSLAGMDEAGRGALIGDVVVGCVIMPPEPLLPWVDDSKKLSPERREEVFEQIKQIALYVGVGKASAQEIDEINILQATKLAMQRAAKDAPATLCLVDSVKGLALPFPTQPMDHGDATSYSIAAASIVAKVSRDRMMKALDEQYPEYGIGRHMGYGTQQHIEALRQFGVCPEHRMTFVGKFITQGKEGCLR